MVNKDTPSKNIQKGANKDKRIERNTVMTMNISDKLTKLDKCIGKYNARPGFRMEAQDKELIIQAMEGVILQLGDVRVYQG
ncbi:hypothetical protein [Endozoicomonas sp. SESOKO1]|uniref:hypothetical protein n=1 Tax=Endozoicomonas sp. SESOKO1 TaxID=2828742 RepID=UPI002147FFC4|nr:hypothetical protein [Endozoicomonas sp. SESOKO1]